MYLGVLAAMVAMVVSLVRTKGMISTHSSGGVTGGLAGALGEINEILQPNQAGIEAMTDSEEEGEAQEGEGAPKVPRHQVLDR